MFNSEIARIFDDIADLLEIQGENLFRIRAYRRAAQNITAISDDLSRFSSDELLKLPGIGKDLALKIREYSETGKVSALEELKTELPDGILDLIAVPGLGPKTAKLLFDKLGISNLEQLEEQAKTGRLRELPHIKGKTEQNILKGIELLKRGKERLPIGTVRPIAEEILETLRKKAPLKEISLAGSIRRWKETIKDIDILVTSQQPENVMGVFTSLPNIATITSKGKTKSSVMLTEGISVDVRVVDESCYGSALQYFTGSKEHNITLREIAVKKGLKINEYGIFDEKSGARLGGKKEREIYSVLGMDYVEPELREDRGEITAATAHTLPKLIELNDIQGDLHVHSNWSDGSHSIEDIARAAQKLGFAYIALTDHSKGLGVAHGLTEERMINQIEEIDKINKKLKGFTVLKGTEVDIRSDGTLDLPDNILELLDIVVASVHSGFKQPMDQITSRLISAMENPHVTIIAHPTGRLIGERDAYEVDMEKLLECASVTETAIEINAYPLRLDLNDIYAKKAKEMGIPLVISTDTHVSTQYQYMKYGVGVARRGWLSKADVINTMAYKDLKRFLSLKRNRRS